jgi:maltose-binding protein MalE
MNVQTKIFGRVLIFSVCLFLYSGFFDNPLFAAARKINVLCFHFEPRAYHLTQDVIKDTIDQYILTYRDYLYQPDALKQRMIEDFSFAVDQVAQKKIFKILDHFKEEIRKQEHYKNIDLTIKVHFILWDEAFAFLQQEAKNPTFSVAQIAHAFLGGVAEYNNIVPLDQFFTDSRPQDLYNKTCLKSCRIENRGDLLALPFWASMRSLLIRKDMIEACPGLEMDSIFQDWSSFEAAGKHFNTALKELSAKGFPNLRSFWAINISDKDMNTLQTLTPAIYSYGGNILADKFWWKEMSIDRLNALNGIKTFFTVAKSVGSLEEGTFGDLLNQFHSGHFAVVLCGTWENMYWKNTKPDSAAVIEIRLPPRGPEGSATLQWGCNLIILKKRGEQNYDLEFELIRYLSTAPEVQHRYIPMNSRLSVLKTVQDSVSNPDYYRWLNDEHIARTYPNNKEMFKLIDALTQKYHLASILQAVMGAPELSPEIWKVIESGIKTTAYELNKQVIPKPIFYLFYTKINILFITVLFSIFILFFIQIVKRVRRSEDEKIVALTEQLKRVSEEKLVLQAEEDRDRKKLKENQELMDLLSKKLEQVSREFEQLKTNATLDKIEQYTIQIRELTLKNQVLQSELENTIHKITDNDAVIGQLEKELDEFKHPEIIIDFENKIIRKKDGNEFNLSSAANQYKNDVFRYLEYIVRYQKNRIHLLEFALNDSKFFLKALQNDRVREYNYKGKFAKVRSGINRTFKDNIGRDLIIQDKSKIYVYCKKPKRILQISTKEKDLELSFAENHQLVNSEVFTYFGYDAFDYYQINPHVIMHSNIRESADCYEAALKIQDIHKRKAKLEEAFDLDNKNYAALQLILDSLAFKDIEIIQTALLNLQNEISTIENFLNHDINYRKNITNIRKTKQEYKDLYSWKYVNSLKSKEITVIGDIAVGEIIKYETEKISDQLNKLIRARTEIENYFKQFEKLNRLRQYFEKHINKAFLKELMLDYIGQENTKSLFTNTESDLSEIEIKKSFIRHLLLKFNIETDPDNNGSLINQTVNLFEWLHVNNISDKPGNNLSEFFQRFEIDQPDRMKIERFCSSFGWLKT